MKKGMPFFLWICTVSCIACACNKKSANDPPVLSGDTTLVNTSHLDYLYIPVTFPGGSNAAGVFIYSEAPDYHFADAGGEGYTCVDDVARAALVYMRSNKFSTDSLTQLRVINLIGFLLGMQSSNGYFYNFLLTSNQINTNGATSINNPEWWSWRALQTLTEGSPLVKKVINAELSGRMDQAVNKLVAAIKTDLVNIPQTTKLVTGVPVPEWLPAGSGADQAALLILGLIPYCTNSNDAVMTAYVKKLADGIALMQQGDATHFPYGAFLSWENTWHAYGNDQAYALLKAGVFLNDPQYSSKALAEVDNFYPWLLQNGLKSSFVVTNSGNGVQLTSEKSFEQIAYGIRPMVFAAIEAYRLTGDDKYADIAGHLSAWFLGNNAVSTNMYSITTGRCYDAISSTTNVNNNSGAESTIEALLTMERLEMFPAVKIALDKYKK